LGLRKRTKEVDGGHIGLVEEMRNECKNFVGKLQRIRPLVRPRRGWQDNIKMEIK
jgi:hypothetical protein